MQTRRRTIAVVAGEASPVPMALLTALGAMFDVEFATADEVTGREAGALLFGGTADEAQSWADRGVRTMWLMRDSAAVASRQIEFSHTTALAACFRGRTLQDKSLDHCAAVATRAGDCVIARRGGEPVWVRRPGAASPLDVVGAQPGDLRPGEYVYQYLEEDNWARLLPILHFLREVSGWQPPPIRACLMFDDPNLHWRSYGYLRFGEIARHAAELNYHAAFAMIPLDSWYVHQETARLFQKHTERLSVLFHGNNHTYYELTQAKTEAAREALAAQALRRIERFERASGISVDRAMAAPHGACSVAMADVLFRSGFEVACISRSSLMGRNPEIAWPLTVGMTPAEFVGAGVPVIPRFNVRWSSSYALFAAFLGQPIILVGHHDDVADGLDLLAHWATFINGMGETHWCSPESMARTNYSLRHSGADLEIEMFSRKIDLVVPEGCSRIYVRRPWLRNGATEELFVMLPKKTETFCSNGEVAVNAVAGERVVISSPSPNRLDVSKVATYLPGPWAVTRRQLCEVRDRLRPMASKLKQRKRRVADAD